MIKKSKLLHDKSIIVVIFFISCSALLYFAYMVLITAQHDRIFYEYINKEECIVLPGGIVIFRGETSKVDKNSEKTDLVECLRKSNIKKIHELHITSVGGDAWNTLQLANEYRNRIDTAIVEYLCASSCANYIIPIAKNIIITKNAYILIHGSINIKQIMSTIKASKEDAVRKYPKVPVNNINKSFDEMILEQYREQNVQNIFENEYIKCKEWLHPEVYKIVVFYGVFTVKGFVIHKSFVERCLKRVNVIYYFDNFSTPFLPSNLRKQNFVAAD